MPENSNTDYINSTKYDTLVGKLTNLRDIAIDLTAKSLASRKLRYAEIDIDKERAAGRIAPDEIYVPQHIIDTNIRREQSSYVQYITQSPRAVILKDKNDPSFDLSLLETDLTEKLRFDGWQLGMYANIDGFQANGYGVMETVREPLNPGEIGREYVQYGDFCFIADTRDIQKVEMLSRVYYFTRTKLQELSNNSGEDKWDSAQVKKLLDSEPNDENNDTLVGASAGNRSLYKIMKVMFKVKGYVQVAWCCPTICDGWLRAPRPLYLGRRKVNEKAAKAARFVSVLPPAAIKMAMPEITDEHIQQMKGKLPPSDAIYETQYPYFLYPYLISENDTIANLKGRVYLDQDTQNAASSLMSCTLSQARRASYLMFARETTDANDEFLTQKNIQCKPGAVIDGKLKEMKLDAPDATMFSAINMLVSSNAQETSQVNFAETNRQGDSRKTATAVKASMSQQQQLSGIQVTLFSISLKAQYTFECEIIKSRVLCGVIKVNPTLMALYARNFTVKPSGDTDVIERAQMIQTMQQSWPVYENTPVAQAFLIDLTEKLFPDAAPKYIKAFQDAQAAQQSQQGQQMQQAIGIAKQMGMEITELDAHPEYFSETGRVHVYPKIQQAAQLVKQISEATQQK